MLITDKEKIGKTFSKSFPTYKNEAIVQKEIVTELLNCIVNSCDTEYKKVLEIGCGTGFLTKEIQSKIKVHKYYANDLVVCEGNCRVSKNNYTFIKGDAETLDLPNNLDAIFSSSCFQWFVDFEKFVIKANNLLNKNGIFAFSSFGPAHYNQIKTILGVGLKYNTKNELKSIVSEKFEIIDIKEWSRDVKFENPISVLKHMKNTGVNMFNGSYFGKDKLKQFTDSYLEHFLNSDKTVSLTYNPIIIIAKKR